MDGALACLLQALTLPGQLCGWPGTRRLSAWRGWRGACGWRTSPEPAPGSERGLEAAGTLGCRAPFPPPLLLGCHGDAGAASPAPAAPAPAGAGVETATRALLPQLPPVASHKQEMRGQVSRSHPGSPPSTPPPQTPLFARLATQISLSLPVPLTAEEGGNVGLCYTESATGSPVSQQLSSSPAPQGTVLPRPKDQQKENSQLCALFITEDAWNSCFHLEDMDTLCRNVLLME